MGLVTLAAAACGPGVLDPLSLGPVDGTGGAGSTVGSGGTGATAGSGGNGALGGGSAAGGNQCGGALHEWDLEQLQLQSVIAAPGASGCSLAAALALDEGVLAVGWPEAEGLGGASNAGEASLFGWSGNDWVLEATLRREPPAVDGLFGRHLSLSASTLLVDPGADDHWVFTHGGGAWTHDGSLACPSGGDLGALALAGDVAVAHWRDAELSNCTGAYTTFVFERSGSSWPVVASFVGECVGGPAFGICGDTFVATSWGASQSRAMVRFFSRAQGIWAEGPSVDIPTLVATDMAMAIAIDADIVVVGVPSDSSDRERQGAAFVLVPRAGGWELEAKLTAPDAGDHDYFGWSVAASSGFIAVGAPSSTLASQPRPGRTYLFQRVSGMWQNLATLTAGEIGDEFGRAVTVEWPWLAIEQPRPNGACQGAVWLYRVP